ncbi:hypothetical protein A2U01_0084239, partial [Trifolium medium]|nr:hypothetical protein [Trifolium medium]
MPCASVICAPDLPQGERVVLHVLYKTGNKLEVARCEVKCYLCVLYCLSRFQKCDCITWKMQR